MVAVLKPNNQRRASGNSDGKAAPHLDLLIGQLVRSLRVAVIYGGDKRAAGAVLRETHNPRSWKSYESVARNIADSLTRLGFVDVAVIPDDMRLASQLKARRINLAWINSGGVQGRDAECTPLPSFRFQPELA